MCALTTETTKGNPMIPPKYPPVPFGFILSGRMSLRVSGICTYSAVGLDAQSPGMWAWAWLTAWLIAFPVVLVVAPPTRRVVGRLTSPH